MKGLDFSIIAACEPPQPRVDPAYLHKTHMELLGRGLAMT